MLIILLCTSLIINNYLYISNKKYKLEILKVKSEISETYEYLNSLTLVNFQEKVRNGQEFYVYIGRPDCGDCSLFEPMFKRIVESYNLYDDIYYLNIKKFREENQEEWETFKRKYGFTQTPAIIHFLGGNNISIIEWDEEKGLSEKRFIDWLKENNLIEK